MSSDWFHPAMSCVALMIYQAYIEANDRITIMRTEERLEIFFSTANDSKQQDFIPSSFWHALLSALHLLAAETTFHLEEHKFKETMEGVDLTDLPAAFERYGNRPISRATINQILITQHFPQVDNTSLAPLQRVANLNLQIAVSCSDSQIELTLLRTPAV